MSKPNQLPSLDSLRGQIAYDELSGNFTWLQGRRGRSADLSAGYVNAGYLRICVDGKSHQGHRLAFFIHHGRAPCGEIDHIDGNTLNNAASNLREATRLENSRNRKSSRGVFLRRDVKKNPYQARIKFAGKLLSLGCFPTEALARAAYVAAANRYFGEFSPAINPEMVGGVL